MDESLTRYIRQYTLLVYLRYSLTLQIVLVCEVGAKTYVPRRDIFGYQ